MAQKLILGVSGEKGSFSEEAGELYSQQAGHNTTLDYLVDMEGVLSAVSAGRVDLGIFPVVNARGGLVKMAFDAMGKYLFFVEDQFVLNVQQCLLARPGIAFAQIEKIASHPQGFAQCEKFLEKELKSKERLMWQDTAKAARELAEGALDARTAVIASAKAASLYGLGVIAEGIQDIQPNLTTFIIVSRRLPG